jgi:hypothetical protein
VLTSSISITIILSFCIFFGVTNYIIANKFFLKCGHVVVPLFVRFLPVIVKTSASLTLMIILSVFLIQSFGE